MALVRIEHLKKYFHVSGGTLHAVDDVSLSIEKAETLGIVGESGCGKSTLGKTITRLIEPTEGTIYFQDREIVKLSKRQFKKVRPQMQMIFQDPLSSLDPRKTVMQTIEEPMVIYHIGDKHDREQRAKELMDTAGISLRFAHSYPHEMDGGRRQRVGIARALALNPEFIVCDEPVSALDVSIQAQILNLLQDLQRDKQLTYIFITHDMSVVKHISTHIAVMYLGQIIEKCEAKELFLHTLHPYSQALLSSIPVPNVHIKKKKILLKGELTSPINPKKACRFAPRCMYATSQCWEEEPQLNDVGNGHFVACHKVGNL